MMLILKDFYWMYIIISIMQVGMIATSSAGLLTLGSITAGFIKQLENLDAGDELRVGRNYLAKFRRLKKGLSPYLFAEFSVNTLAMIVLVFLLVGCLKPGTSLIKLLVYIFFTLFVGVQMLYIGVMADETKSKFDNVLAFLR